MSSSKGFRRGDDRKDRDRDDHPRKNQESGIAKPLLAEFFLDGEGIDREVLQTSIWRFLGNEATSSPHTHEGRKGYKIRAVRPFTPAMIDDLKAISAEFSTERQARSRRDADMGPLRYVDSQVGRRDFSDTMDSSAMDYEPSQSSRTSHSQGGLGMGYNQEGSTLSYTGQYGQDPSLYPFSSPMHQPNPYAHSYTTYPPQNNAIPAYSDSRPYGEYSNYVGPNIPQGQQYGAYTQGYGESSRAPPYNQNQAYGDPSRGQGPGPIPGTLPGQQYSYAPTALPPRSFEDPNFPFAARPPNQPGHSQYGPPPSSGASGAYGEGQRERERDAYNRQAPDYAPRRR